MAGAGDSLTGAEAAAGLAVEAVRALAERRGGADHPGLYDSGDHPWTDQLARLVREGLNERLGDTPDPERRHVIAAHWRFPSLLAHGPADPARNPLYDLAWRVYPADCGQLQAQPLIASTVWRGGWAACAPACDRLAQGLAGVRLLTAMADPESPVGEMSLVQACAFRISAFAPKGGRVVLAFYGGAKGWRESPGFAVYSYETGAASIQPLS